MLAPLTRITDATRAASGGSLAHRIRMPGRQDEFRELADAFDGMLERLEAHVAEQQRFAANASHELRTPLAITQTLLEVARADPGRESDELLDRLQVVNGRAIDLTEALLVLSRADQRAFAREAVDLSLVAEEAAETLHPAAEAQGVTVSVEGDAAVALGSPALLQQLATNLVQNAVLHNSGSGGWVRVVTTAVPGTAGLPGTAVLSVENTGEVLAPAVVATLTEPFQRGTARIRSPHGAGVGLGLAIVRRIADAHGGTLELAAREGGGLRATVTLPAATTAAR
jgi:two-component system sensor histidine kinase VanS